MWQRLIVERNKLVQISTQTQNTDKITEDHKSNTGLYTKETTNMDLV
jgi:hypothetical protein